MKSPELDLDALLKILQDEVTRGNTTKQILHDMAEEDDEDEGSDEAEDEEDDGDDILRYGADRGGDGSDGRDKGEGIGGAGYVGGGREKEEEEEGEEGEDAHRHRKGDHLGACDGAGNENKCRLCC